MSGFARFIIFVLGLFLMLLSLTSFFDNNLGVANDFISPMYPVTETPVLSANPATATVAAGNTQLANATQDVAAAGTLAALTQLAVNSTQNPATATIAAGFTQLAISTQTQFYALTPTARAMSGLRSLLIPNTLNPAKHTVRSGEYLYCIGRAYGVDPKAIAEFNGLAFDAILRVGTVLEIPDSLWLNIPPGRVCRAQFQSPYSPKPLPTPTYGVGIIPHRYTSFGKSLILINFTDSNKTINIVNLQATEFTATPTHVPFAPFRTVYIDFPMKMNLGESGIVILTFNPSTGQSSGSNGTPPTNSTLEPTSTPNPNREIVTSTPIHIQDESHDYRVFAIARLDATGFEYSPKEDLQKEINGQEPLQWQWSIKPLEARSQEIIISLRLHYEPRPDIKPLPSVRPELDIWNESYPVEVDRPVYDILFGSQAPILPAVGGFLLLLISVGKDGSALFTWMGQKIKPTKQAPDVK